MSQNPAKTQLLDPEARNLRWPKRLELFGFLVTLLKKSARILAAIIYVILSSQVRRKISGFCYIFQATTR